MAGTPGHGESKPGGPQSKNLIPLTERSPEEALELRRKGNKAAQKKRRENAEKRTIIRQVLAMGLKKGTVIDPDKLDNFEEALVKNVPIQTIIVMREVQKYIELGDTEARNWLFKHAFPEDEPSFTLSGSGALNEDSGAEVRVHLIRGEKPKMPEDENGEATHGEDVPSGGATL